MCGALAFKHIVHLCLDNISSSKHSKQNLIYIIRFFYVQISFSSLHQLYNRTGKVISHSIFVYYEHDFSKVNAFFMIFNLDPQTRQKGKKAEAEAQPWRTITERK